MLYYYTNAVQCKSMCGLCHINGKWIYKRCNDVHCTHIEWARWLWLWLWHKRNSNYDSFNDIQCVPCVTMTIKTKNNTLCALYMNATAKTRQKKIHSWNWKRDKERIIERTKWMNGKRKHSSKKYARIAPND